MPTTGGTGEVTVLAHVTSLISEIKANFGTQLSNMDLRYQQRFDASQKALETALLAAEKAVQAALASADKATEKSAQDALRWRESSNEWRASMNDREIKFVNVDVFAETINGLRAEIRTKGIQAVLGFVAGFIGIISTVITVAIVLSR